MSDLVQMTYLVQEGGRGELLGLEGFREEPLECRLLRRANDGLRGLHVVAVLRLDG